MCSESIVETKKEKKRKEKESHTVRTNIKG
jgi:hypothetical protein